MRRVCSLGLALLLAFAPVLGCSREASTKKTTTVETPEGKTTVTEKTTVEKSGENPPPAPPR